MTQVGKVWEWLLLADGLRCEGSKPRESVAAYAAVVSGVYSEAGPSLRKVTAVR